MADVRQGGILSNTLFVVYDILCGYVDCKRERERERENFIRHITHNTIDKPIETSNGRLPECNNHHCWPPMINNRQ